MAVRFTIPRLRQGAAGAPRSSESGHLMIDTDAASHPPRRRSSAVVALAALIVVSAVARSIVAWQHSIPRLFPDEYIYTAIGRSIGHGHFAIRGGTVRFPAVFEPIVAAPIWRLFSPGLAYHLVQVENAIVASLAAIPVYLIARKLRLSDGWALAAAAYAVLVPELVLVAYISSDAVGYTLAVTAVAFAVYSLDKPTTRAQVGFLIFASLAALTRVEYIVLAPAYLMVALYLDRKAILRHAIALLALLPAIGVALAGAFGYYLTDGRGGSLVTSGFLNWLVLQPYLAALVLGVAIVPGALVGLLGTRTRAEKAYALFFAATFILILIESSKVAAATHEFKERYLFLLIALAPLSFALYVKNGLRYPKVAVAIAVVLIVTVARLADLRICRVVVQDGLSVALCHQSGRGSLVGLDGLACSCAHRHRRSCSLRSQSPFVARAAVALAISLIVAGAATAAATQTDLSTTRAVRAKLPSDLRWVDHAARGPVTAIETPIALPRDLLYELYFNESITREMLIGSAIPTDAFHASPVKIRRDGTLSNVAGDVLFHDFGTSVALQDARRVATSGHFTLWRPNSIVRLRYLLEGRYWDDWLAAGGRLRAWPTNPAHGVKVSFRLSLPRKWSGSSKVQIGSAAFFVRPGDSIRVTCTSASGPLDQRFRARQTFIDAGDFRTFSVRLTDLVVADLRGKTGPASCS